MNRCSIGGILTIGAFLCLTPPLFAAAKADAAAPAAVGAAPPTYETDAKSQWPSTGTSVSDFTSVGVVENSAPSLDQPDSAVSTPDLETLSKPLKPLKPGDPRYGDASGGSGLAHLPAWANWGLLLIGLGIIGFAIRGLVDANRRLARLEKPEEDEE
jgi:hypothetical protein